MKNLTIALLVMVLAVILIGCGGGNNGSNPTPNLMITVNYDLTVEELIAAGRFDYVSPDITSLEFPSSRTGTTTSTAKLLMFSRLDPITSDWIIIEMKRNGMGAGELKELLVLGTKYPDLQRQFNIVALGSVAVTEGQQVVPVLGNGGPGGGGRYIYTNGWRSEWRGKAFRFLAFDR